MKIKRYFPYLKKYRRHCILGPIAKWIEAVLELLVPLVMADIIDTGVADGDVSYVLWGGALMLVMGAAGFGFALFCQRSASIASQGFGTAVRDALFEHVNTLSGRELDKIGAASLSTRITTDVTQMQSALAMIIRLVVRAPFIALGAVILCMVIDWQIGLFVLFAAALVGLVLWLIMKKSVPYYAKNQRKLDRLTQITNENLEGARVVRAFVSRDSETERFDAAAADMMDNSLKIGRISAWLNPLTCAIVNFGVAVILLWSGFKVDAGALTSGEIIALINYMTQILNAMIVISNLVSLFTKGYASMNRVTEVFELSPSVTDGAGASFDFSAPAVEFDGVSFSYAGNENYSLRDVNLSIGRGETIGIIGGTGSGKSTFAHLLSRLYDATKGRILVYGHDVRDYTLRELRDLFGVVPQNAEVFSGTVRENLEWGDPAASDEKLYRALETACADGFVREKGGLDAAVTEGGKNFSGGQKQRLTIARAVASDPGILVLDDSCSALDFATDAKLRANLAKLDGLTTIIISQRASSIRGADRIFVFEDGKIAGAGKHDALYAGCPLYREICDSQTKVTV